jgi:tRNA pseudouridine13 synthase
VIAAERMNSERRALRIRVAGLAWEWDADVLRLRFELGAGSFATTVLREIIAASDGETPC